MDQINFNGKIIPKKEFNISIDNRSFNYGDGFFETIRLFDDKLPFLSLHIERLLKGLEFAQFKIPKKYNTPFFKKEIYKGVSKNKNLRIKLHIFRSNGGFYTPKNNKPIFVISYTDLKTKEFKLNKVGLDLAYFDQFILPRWDLNGFKSCNSLPYIIAGHYKDAINKDDCILFNDKHNIVEASSSNIFFLKNNILYTPPLKDGCLAGTMRKILCTEAPNCHIKVKEKSIKKAHLKTFDQAFLSNSITGIQWIKSIDNNQFRKNLAIKTLFNHINKMVHAD